MEEVQGESEVSEVLCQCWIPEKQEGYTVPDFVRQIRAAWKKLNNITTPEEPEEEEWE